MSPEDMLSQIQRHTSGWPKNIAGVLTCDEPEGIIYLNKDTEFFGWLHGRFDVTWGKSSLPKAEFFQYCRQHCEKFDMIADYPHHPQLQGVYYRNRPAPAEFDPEDSKLERFLDFFQFASEHDRQLGKAMLMTSLWGGPPGTRPLFVVTTDSDRPGEGIGYGKSSFVQFVSDITGGYIDVPQDEKLESLKKRLLSPEPGVSPPRFIILDNLKSMWFSSPGIESLVTSRAISGWRIYNSETRVPNYYLLVITVNGGSLSRDLASRAVTIKLGRAAYRQDWVAEVTEFLSMHRWAIIDEVCRLLDGLGVDLPNVDSSRWGCWEKGVLSHVENAEAVRAEFRLRQRQLDADATNAQEFFEMLRDPTVVTRCHPNRYEAHDEYNGIRRFCHDDMRKLLSDFSGKSIGGNKVKKQIDSLGLSCLRQVTIGGRSKFWFLRLDGSPWTDESIAAYTRHS